MNNQHPVYTLINECHDCYKCVRECPVKAIKIENDHASVIPEKCISCGTCVQVCPANAKCVRSDLEKVKNLLITGKDEEDNLFTITIIGNYDLEFVY